MESLGLPTFYGDVSTYKSPFEEFVPLETNSIATATLSLPDVEPLAQLPDLESLTQQEEINQLSEKGRNIYHISLHILKKKKYITESERTENLKKMVNIFNNKLDLHTLKNRFSVLRTYMDTDSDFLIKLLNFKEDEKNLKDITQKATIFFLRDHAGIKLAVQHTLKNRNLEKEKTESILNESRSNDYYVGFFIRIMEADEMPIDIENDKTNITHVLNRINEIEGKINSRSTTKNWKSILSAIRVFKELSNKNCESAIDFLNIGTKYKNDETDIFKTFNSERKNDISQLRFIKRIPFLKEAALAFSNKQRAQIQGNGKEEEANLEVTIGAKRTLDEFDPLNTNSQETKRTK